MSFLFCCLSRREYQKGCDWEIYTTSLSDIFVGAKFSELSLALYEKLGVVLFALQLTQVKKKGNKTGKSKLLLNPANFLIPDKKEYRIETFVIAKNKATSDLSFSGKGQHDAASAFSVMGDGLHTISKVIKGPERRRTSVVMLHPGSKTNSINTSMHKAHSTSPLGAHAPVNQFSSSNLQEKEHKAPEKKRDSRWKALKRSALLEKKVQSFSYQEILQRLEDEHLVKN